MNKKTSDLQLNEFSATHPAEPENSGEVNSYGRFQTLKRKTHKAAKMLLTGNYTHFWLSAKNQIRRPKNEKVALAAVNVIITQKCTLKCKGCHNLMQYYENPQNLCFDQISRDVDALFEKVKFIDSVVILGGEPLIAKTFVDVMACIFKYKKQYGELQIYTNGTICPSDDTLKAMKKYNLFVNISDYGKHSVNLSKLESALKKEKINYITNENLEWRSIMNIVDGKSKLDLETQKTYENCVTDCNYIMNGKFYRCAFLNHGDELRIFSENPDNYVDLLDPATNEKTILDYVNRKTAYPGCRFCSGYNMDLAKPIPTAEQIKEPLPYVRHEAMNSEN